MRFEAAQYLSYVYSVRRAMIMLEKRQDSLCGITVFVIGIIVTVVIIAAVGRPVYCQLDRMMGR